MGANTFQTSSIAKTAREAFAYAVQNARHEYGHRGYTGTIAEVSEFAMVDVPRIIRENLRAADPQRRADARTALRGFVADLLESDRFSSKWGPCACLDLGPEIDESAHPLAVTSHAADHAQAIAAASMTPAQRAAATRKRNAAKKAADAARSKLWADAPHVFLFAGWAAS